MDEDVAKPEPSGDARASGLAAAAPGVPRRALAGSGKTETRLLSNGAGTVASGLALEPPWQKRQRKALEEFKRDNPVYDGVHIDLKDRWADTPGKSCTSPELVQLCGGPGPAVVAPPALPGTPHLAPTVVLQKEELVKLYGRLRDTNPGLDEVFVDFASFGLQSHRDTAEQQGSIREQLACWHESGGGVGSRDGCEVHRDNMDRLFHLLRKEMGDG